MALQNAELPARLCRRGQHHQAGAVARVAGVVAHPHRAPAKRPQAQGLHIGPGLPAVHHAALQLCQREHAVAVIEKPAHQQVLEFLRAVLQPQLVNVEQVAAAAHGVHDGDDLPPNLVFTRKATGQPVVRKVQRNAFVLRPLLVEAVTRPQREGLVLDAGRRGKVGFAPVLVHGHAAGHLVQLRKFARPEALVKIEIAVVALGRQCIGAKEIQRGAIAQNNRIARQLQVAGLLCKGHDVLFENVRLGLRCTEKNLIAARGDGIGQGFAGKVPSGPNLPRLENEARAQLAIAKPHLLIVEQRIAERIQQLFVLFLREVVALGAALGLVVARLDGRVQVRLLARFPVLLHTGQALNLPAQQVNFLEVAAGLAVLHHQLHQPGFERGFYALSWLRLVPVFGILPALHRAARLTDVFGNARNAPALPVQMPRRAALVGGQAIGGNGGKGKRGRERWGRHGASFGPLSVNEYTLFGPFKCAFCAHRRH